MRSEFTIALLDHQAAFGLALTTEQIDRLADYYDLIQEHNPILHLVGPSTPEEFAVRHILESLTLLEYLPQRAKFADVGTGAGLPSIPCLLVREDLRGVLIESKEKKAAFLTEAVTKLNITDRAVIANKQYAEVEPAGFEFVTCRALDKFTDKLPHLIRWARSRKLLLFGGKTLGAALKASKLKFVQKLIPMSERRFLFIVER
jgi:16S rRNA (guanine527-N7)-methyltransferase